jgi:hypothetical protein
LTHGICLVGVVAYLSEVRDHRNALTAFRIDKNVERKKSEVIFLHLTLVSTTSKPDIPAVIVRNRDDGSFWKRYFEIKSNKEKSFRRLFN